MNCCGQPMEKDGPQLVCGKCGGWVQPGVTRHLLAVAAVAAVLAGLALTAFTLTRPNPVLADDAWQCNQCGNWFTGARSQTCPACS